MKSSDRWLGAAGRRLADWWHDRPFRWQILFAIALLTLVASLVSGVFAVLDARNRARIETRSNIDLWSSHIIARARELKSAKELGGFASHLAAEMATVRHVSVEIYDAGGNPLLQDTPKRDDSEAEERAPDWFVKLVQPDIGTRSFSIGSDGQRFGSVLITGVPDDEIAEAWELLSLMAVLWLSAMALIMVGLYFILDLILTPLAKLARGLSELEGGDYAIRLDMPRVRELETIATSFNTLAVALESTNDENSRLYRQLIDVQEEERREISRDLHDEFGPCLFGIMAATAAVARHAKSLPEDQAKPIVGCIDEIVHVSEHLKGLNRGLLNRLRPMALGRHSLADLLAELISTFERRHSNVRFQLRSQGLSQTFGEAVDLALYRCVQEAITNAVRHGQARTVSIDLAEQTAGGERSLSLRIVDTGTGMKSDAQYGYGLSSMRERVRELGGTLRLEPNIPHGTILSVTLPLSNPEP